MKQLTGTELQQARQAAANRYYEIGLAILKEAGVATWTFHEGGLRGRAWFAKKHIDCPKPTTRRRLYILAHECAHIALGHSSSRASHRQEFEAEKFAHDALRRHGVAVPKKESDRARAYVARRIDQAIRMGKATKLDREAVKWTRTKHRRTTQDALTKGGINLTDLGRKARTRQHARSKVNRTVRSVTLADRLRAAARTSGMSVNKIAAAVGVDQSALNRFLAGTRDNIRLDVAQRLIDFFGLTIVTT